MAVEYHELIKDVLKLIAIFLPLLYFLIKGRDIIVRDKRLSLLIIGFSIMLLGGLWDFAGDIPALDNIRLLGKNDPHHEAAEDILGIIGFVLFGLGIAAEIQYIRKDNIEKKNMIQKLKEQAGRLERFDALKSKFIEDVSHEFRSPLSSINLSFGNIIDGLMGEVTDKQKEILNSAKRNVDRLSRLVEDMLTLSSIESGKMAMRRKFNDISAIAEEAHLSLKPILESKNIVFDKVCYLDDPKVWCDEDKITQVFVNILANSIKYSSPDSRINVRIAGETNEIRVEIEDHGKGIAQEDIEKLFNRFERLRAEKDDGTGLGLVIAKEIIDMHHGKIWVQSREEEGTRFIFTLPRDIRKEEHQKA